MKLSQVKLKLAKMLVNFEEVIVDGITYTYEGALDYGTEVFIEKEGELVPANEGEFTVEDKIYTIQAGKITKINGEEEGTVEETIEMEEVIEETIEQEIAEEIVEIQEEKEEQEAIEEVKEEMFDMEIIKTLMTELQTLKEEIELLKGSMEKGTEELQQFKSQVAGIELAQPVWNEVKEVAKKDIKGAGKYFAAL